MPAKRRPKDFDFLDATQSIDNAVYKLQTLSTLLDAISPDTILELNDKDITGAGIFLDEIVQEVRESNEFLYKFCRQEGK